MRVNATWWLAAIAGVCWISTAQAQERYAVLVGVGAYENLEERLQLRGPPNDVALMHAYLTNAGGFDEDNVVALTDNGPRAPRRRDILGALGDLEDRLTEGDFVLLYFAGHGSRQPADAGAEEEADGYDEIFLPADVRGWNRSIGAVEDAIVDDEVAAVIDRYRQRGANVWAVFDSCHSGTMTRGVGDAGVRTRKIEPADLGVPDAPAEVTERSERPAFMDMSDERLTRGAGWLVSFFASHSGEETPEKPLPRGAEASEQRVYGLFTYSLVNALRGHPNASYAELAALVSAEYASIPHTQSTPQFYGTDMNQRVFGGGERPSVFRGVVEAGRPTRVRVGAGSLHGLDVGAGVSIHASPVEEEASGFGTVERATFAESTLRAEWGPGSAVPETEGAAVWARVVHPSYSPVISISQLEMRESSDNEALSRIVGALQEAEPPLVEFDRDDVNADYFAAFFDGRFWLLRPEQQLPCSARRLTREERRECERTRDPEPLFWSTPAEVGTLVQRAARASNLVRLQAFSSVPSSLLLDVQVERAGAVLSLEETSGALEEGDRVFVNMANIATGEAWDVFFFYVDANLGIQALQAYGASARLRGGDTRRTALGTISTDTVGTESLVIIVDPADDGVEANYGFLAQEAVPAGGQGTAVGVGLEFRGGPASPLQAVLDGVWRGDGNAGLRALGASASRAHIRVFTWRVES